MNGDHGHHRQLRPVAADELGRHPGRASTTPRPRGRDRRVRVLHAGAARRPLVRRAHCVAGRSGRAVCRLRRSRAASGSRSSRRCGPTSRTCTRSATRSTSRIAPASRVIADLGNCWMERDYEDDRSGAPVIANRGGAVRRRRVGHGAAAAARRAARSPATATSPSTRSSSRPRSTLDTTARSSWRWSDRLIEAEGHDAGACGAPSQRASALLEEVLA